MYTVSVGRTATPPSSNTTTAWYRSPATSVVCVAGKQTPLHFLGVASASGNDTFGAWTGTTASFSLSKPAGNSSSTAGVDVTAAVDVTYTFKNFAPARPGVAVATAAFPKGLDTSNCGSNTEVSESKRDLREI